MAAIADHAQPYIPLSGSASDGWSKDNKATATCYCGAVQLAFPTAPPGLMRTFVCHCTDCRKITHSMFATNFTIDDNYLTHVRGKDNLTKYAQNHTTSSGKEMANYFCATCGTLMYRVGETMPGRSILRVGTVDDFSLHETNLRPEREIYVDERVSWVKPIEGAAQLPGGGVSRRKMEEGGQHI